MAVFGLKQNKIMVTGSFRIAPSEKPNDLA